MKFIRFLMAIFFSIALAACGSSSTPATYAISGTVTSSGAALAGATITLTGGTIATTDASGNYSFAGLANGSYTVTPTKAGTVFSPTSLAVSVSGANVTGTNFAATAAATTYSIAGTVSGAASSGVTITLSGANTGSVVAGTGGVYTLSGLLPGSYTVTPSLSGFTFSPTSTSVTLGTANSTANNFVATAIPVSHSLSGAVSGDTLSGVTITVTGTVTASATTDSSGNYSVTGVYDGSYTITPSKTDYTFTPSSLAVTVSGVAVTGKNFVAKSNAAPTYSISGAVSGAVQSGVSVTLSGVGSATTTSNGSGNYTFAGLVNGSYTITPSMTGYTFSPVNAAATVSGANITGTNFVATAIPTAYTQADLTGTWRINMLRTGSTGGWLRATGTFDSSGLGTVSSFLDSTGNSTPPAAGSTWTISGSGVISETGVNAGSLVHMTMTSNKNFIAGTGSDGNSQLRIAQKVVPGTVYSNADVQNKTFVYHQLTVGSQSKWAYGAGTTDASGAITLTSQADPSGTYTGPDTPGGTISVDGNGVVTMSAGVGMDNFQGFLSDDKKTMVGTVTETGKTNYNLMIIQITGQTYTAGPLPAGTWFAHMLAGGSAPAPLWLHDTITIASGGVMTFSDWVSNNSSYAAPGTTIPGTISTSGTVSIAADPSFHGQVSHDGKFVIGTETIGSGAYSFQVNTK